jgi:hypothetical protein
MDEELCDYVIDPGGFGGGSVCWRRRSAPIHGPGGHEFVHHESRCAFVLHYTDVGVGGRGIPEYCGATRAEHDAHPDWDHPFTE